MTLSDFKRKYHRMIAGHNKPAPFCSDTLPRQHVDVLLAEPWFEEANCVNCSVTFPFESFTGGSPTIAGVATLQMIHHFVDDRLFKITVWFSQVDFSIVERALVSKFGEPLVRTTELYQNEFGATFTGHIMTWDNDVSSMTLMERYPDLDSSWLVVIHHPLHEVFKSREPPPAVEDL